MLVSKNANRDSTIFNRARLYSTFTSYERGLTNYVAIGRGRISQNTNTNEKLKVPCKVLMDNAGAINIVNVPKMRPRTKHLNIKYQHCREEVRKGTFSIYYTRTEDLLQTYLLIPYQKH
jgi:hypothetical protein